MHYELGPLASHEARGKRLGNCYVMLCHTCFKSPVVSTLEQSKNVTIACSLTLSSIIYHTAACSEGCGLHVCICTCAYRRATLQGKASSFKNTKEQANNSEMRYRYYIGLHTKTFRIILISLRLSSAAHTYKNSIVHHYQLHYHDIIHIYFSRKLF